jgi:hypothetical protein
MSHRIPLCDISCFEFEVYASKKAIRFIDEGEKASTKMPRFFPLYFTHMFTDSSPLSQNQIHITTDSQSASPS